MWLYITIYSYLLMNSNCSLNFLVVNWSNIPPSLSVNHCFPLAAVHQTVYLATRRMNRKISMSWNIDTLICSNRLSLYKLYNWSSPTQSYEIKPRQTSSAVEIQSSSHLPGPQPHGLVKCSTHWQCTTPIMPCTLIPTRRSSISNKEKDHFLFLVERVVPLCMYEWTCVTFE